ncbi:hypothetical protein MHU86_14820 [Fragilaria crotonensis]|nr:hypothetical protein MHU86_14820 [Fragilaria crotonensis]
MSGDHACYVHSRPKESGSNCESPFVVSHPSAPCEDETLVISDSISTQRTSGETGGTPQTFQSSIDEGASGICDDLTHFRSGDGPIEFLLVNPSTNDVDAQIGSAIYKLRPRARAANEDSLVGCLENELTVFQQLNQSSCSVPATDGVNAGGANMTVMTVMTGTSCERHSHGTGPRVELCDWSSTAAGLHALSLTNEQPDSHGLGSLAQLFPDFVSCMDEWAGPRMKFKLKPIHSHRDTYATFPAFFHAMKGNMNPHQQLTPC